MRFAIQTILWGHSPSDYERMFDVIANAGFQGVELFQHRDYLPTVTELLNILRSRRLQLLGMCGGGLGTRIAWLDKGAGCTAWLGDREGPFDPLSPYLFIDSWNDSLQEKIAEGRRLAFHPTYLRHDGKANEAHAFLDSHPDLLYLPDTAHSAIHRDDVLTSVRRYSSRLAAVHIKDWRPGFGRVSALYARGFTELGTGVVSDQCAAVLRELQSERHRNTWAVYEQDYTENLVETSVKQSAEFLHNFGLRRLTPFDPIPLTNAPPTPASGSPITIEGVHAFSSQKLASSHVGQLYQRLAQTLRSSLNVETVALWCCSEMDQLLTLQGFSKRGEHPARGTENPKLPMLVEEISGPLGPDWLPVSKIDPEILPFLDSPEGQHKFFRLPIRSVWNPHQTRIVVDLACPASSPKPSTEERTVLAQAVIRSLDWHLEGIMASAGAELNLAATKPKTMGDTLRELVRKRMCCENVAMFLADGSGTSLRPFACDNLLWDPASAEDRTYVKGDGHETTRVWQSCLPRFRGRHPKDNVGLFAKPKSWFGAQRPSETSIRKTLSMPIVDTSGKSIGVVRCVGKLTSRGNPCHFGDDDLLVLDNLFQQAIPALKLYRAAEEERKRNLIIAHELKRPVAAICQASYLLNEEFESEKMQVTLTDYARRQLRTVYRFSENLRLLVMRSHFFADDNRQSQIVKEGTFLMGDIIAPTIGSLRDDLLERGLSPGSMIYDGFQELPKVWVDRGMFQQIIFNLLDNALKYAKKEKHKFRVTIKAAIEEEGRMAIRFSDWGIGIESHMSERIFELGQRSQKAYTHAQGSGIGLWLVRDLLRLHGGRIFVECDEDPTVFKIELPAKLTQKGWKQ